MDSWCGGEATIKSRAKQTEESYQLQLALALRLSSQAASANDPNFLDFSSSDNTKRGLPPYSPESLSHRFWVNGSLSYFDRIPDGFYVIHGLDPYTWSISADSRVPSFESLKAVNDLSIGVVLIDRFRDPGLKEVHNRVIGLSSSLSTTEDVVKHLAIVVCNLMGGLVPNEDDNAFAECWKECTEAMKRRFRSVVLPIGSLSIGLCVHRALLFKVLADSINLPCRIVKGCKYCRRDVVSSCLVQVGNDREYFVDLLRNPGALSQPDSSFNSSSSILVSSPLSHPRFKSNQTTEDFRTLAKLYFLDSQPLNLVFDNSSSGTAIDEDDKFISRLSKDKKNLLPTSSNNRDTSLSSSVLPVRQKYTDPVISNPKRVATNNLLFMELNQSIPSKSNNQLHLEEEDLVVPWSELLLKNKIGSGSFGTVYHADWRGSDVAVKILEEQEFHAERFEEFLSEVAIMKRLRHPNIVLFMGAVTQPPNLSIVMEYLSRGSLHKLLHMNDAALILDERRCLNMAYDVAKGMNYLHQFRPPIVHRDLKSLNLLVDSTYTVKWE
ncbi:PREDICTED: serine/threonine-protein kinase CTR1-like isoform X2 [Populus euphratica]|uniref:non-specific serine/threonine protein kinase n=1 Tax=Populus euphratica TaxID=75702 RepID=A0AAJ6UMU1_POPEU|nr:PREDICTED: serine/threonine-protein kinase CTR1-like isoform X2 [Populus euphratica]